MFSLAALLASAVFVSAAPSTLNARDGCVTAYIDSFTLAAFNTSMPNANLTGAPLVLSQTSGGSDVCGSGNASTNFVLSTYASSPRNPYPTLAMSNGAVAAIGSDMRPVASAPAPGDELSFAPLQGDPDNVFCASWSTDGQYIYELSYSGDVNNWALCPAQSGEVNVVYKPDQNHTSVYDYAQCYPVKLHIVQEGGPHPGCQ